MESQSTEDDQRNCEYLIRRTACFGRYPAQEQTDTVIAYEVQQHRINFPSIYTKVSRS